MKELLSGQSVMAPGGRRVGPGDTWTPVMVECATRREAVCRWAYKRAGWPDAGWAYDFMPEWLKPGWHHDGPATHVPPWEQAEEGGMTHSPMKGTLMADRYIFVFTSTPEEANRCADLTGIEAFRHGVRVEDAIDRLAGFMSTTEPYSHLHPENLKGHAARALAAVLGGESRVES